MSHNSSTCKQVTIEVTAHTIEYNIHMSNGFLRPYRSFRGGRGGEN